MFIFHLEVRQKKWTFWRSLKACENEARISRKEKIVLLVRHLNVPLENCLLPECLYGAREVTSTFYNWLLNVLFIFLVIYLIAFTFAEVFGLTNITVADWNAVNNIL